MIRCLVFDFDGVLVDTNKVKRDAFYSVFSGLGKAGERLISEILARDTDSDRFQIIGSAVDRAVREDLMAPGVNRDELVKDYAAAYNRICEDYASACPEIPGAGAAISSLASNYPLYIISATPSDPLRRIVANRGWGKWFKGILGRPGAKLEHLKRVLQSEAISPHQLLFIGDARRDLDAARAIGSNFIGIQNEFNDFDTTGLKMLADLRDIVTTIEELDTQPTGAK